MADLDNSLRARTVESVDIVVYLLGLLSILYGLKQQSGDLREEKGRKKSETPATAVALAPARV